MAFQPQVTKVHLPRLAVNRCDPPRVVVSGIFSLAYLAELMFICMYINLFVYCLWHTQFFLNTILFGEDVGVIKCQFFFCSSTEGQACFGKCNGDPSTLGADMLIQNLTPMPPSRGLGSTLGMVLCWPVAVMVLLRFPIGQEGKSSAGFWGRCSVLSSWNLPAQYPHHNRGYF